MNIGPNAVHLWFVNDREIRDARLLGRYHEILDDRERARQERFVFDRHKRQYLITRALIRSVMSFYIEDIPPSAWRFRKNAYNKPYIDNQPLPVNLNFNISHTEDMVVAAVTSGDEVGVDVECLSRRGNTLDIAKAYFSPEEFRRINDASPGERRRVFMAIWTLKESYIKACGMGLSIPLNKFSYCFPAQREIRVSFDPDRDDCPDRWKFWQIEPCEGYIVSLAVQKRHRRTAYNISMRNTVPLQAVREVNYPIVAQSPD